MPTIHLHYFSTWNNFIKKNNSFKMWNNFIKSEKYKRPKKSRQQDISSDDSYLYLPTEINHRIILLFKEPFSIEDLKNPLSIALEDNWDVVLKKENRPSTKNQYTAYPPQKNQPEITIWQYENIEIDLPIRSKLLKLIEPITKKMSKQQKRELKFILYKDNKKIITNDYKDIANFGLIFNELKNDIIKEHDRNLNNINCIFTQKLLSRAVSKGNKNTLNIKDSDPIYKFHSEKKKMVYQKLFTILTIGAIFILLAFYVGTGILTHGITLLLFPPLLKLSVVLGGGLVSYTVCGTLAGLTIISGSITFTAIVLSTFQYLYLFWKTPTNMPCNAPQTSNQSDQTLRIGY